MHHRARNFIVELFCKQGRIKTKHCQQNFIAGLFCRRGKTMFIGNRKIRIHYNEKNEGNEVTYNVPNFNISNVFEYRRKILTCHMKELTWPLQAMNTLRTFLTI